MSPVGELAKLTPAEIEFDSTGLRESLDAQLADWRDADLSKVETSSIKAERAEVNRIIKSVEDARKAVKREYNAPLAEFEGEVKNLLAPARELESRLGNVVNARDAERKAKLRQGLEATYEEFAPALAEVVPFDVICEPQWLNLSYGAAKAAEELERKAAKAAKDWVTLRGMGDMPQYGTAEREFFRTLDLSKAMQAAADAAEEQRRIDGLRDEVAPGERRAYVIEVSLTEDEKRRLLGWFRQNGISGTIGERVELYE